MTPDDLEEMRAARIRRERIEQLVGMLLILSLCGLFWFGVWWLA